MYSLSTRFFRSEPLAFICHSWFNPFVHIITLSNLVWNGHPASFSRWFLSDLSICILILSNSIRLCPLRSFVVSFQLITQFVLSQNQFLSDPFVSAVTDQFGTILSSVSYCIRSWFSLCFLIHAQRCSFFTAERIRQCDIRNSYVDREKRSAIEIRLSFLTVLSHFEFHLILSAALFRLLNPESVQSNVGLISIISTIFDWSQMRIVPISSQIILAFCHKLI
jgi:hypothetical protein